VVEEVVGLVNEAEQRIGGDFGRAFFDIGPIGRIGPIGLIGEIADHLSLRVGLGPQRQASLAEEILVVLEQLFQAGAGDVSELELGFLGGGGGLAGL
jgi:hypothetical protein